MRIFRKSVHLDLYAYIAGFLCFYRLSFHLWYIMTLYISAHTITQKYVIFINFIIERIPGVCIVQYDILRVTNHFCQSPELISLTSHNKLSSTYREVSWCGDRGGLLSINKTAQIIDVVCWAYSLTSHLLSCKGWPGFSPTSCGGRVIVIFPLFSSMVRGISAYAFPRARFLV